MAAICCDFRPWRGDRVMRRYSFIAVGILLMLWLAACSPAAARTQPVPSAAADYHPLSVRTGVADVDQVLDALASGQAQPVRSLLGLTSARCTQADGLGGP